MAESLKLSKAERVHDRIFCGVQCTWQSVDDKYRRRRSAIAVGHARDNPEEGRDNCEFDSG